MLRLLGLGWRGRRLVLGVERVRVGLQADRFACLVVAADVSPRAREKVVRLALARGIPVVEGPSAALMGERLGRPAIMVAGVLDRALAAGLRGAAARGAQTEE